MIERFRRSLARYRAAFLAARVAFTASLRSSAEGAGPADPAATAVRQEAPGGPFMVWGDLNSGRAIVLYAGPTARHAKMGFEMTKSLAGCIGARYYEGDVLRGAWQKV